MPRDRISHFPNAPQTRGMEWPALGCLLPAPQTPAEDTPAPAPLQGSPHTWSHPGRMAPGPQVQPRMKEVSVFITGETGEHTRCRDLGGLAPGPPASDACPPGTMAAETVLSTHDGPALRHGVPTQNPCREGSFLCRNSIAGWFSAQLLVDVNCAPLKPKS